MCTQDYWILLAAALFIIGTGLSCRFKSENSYLIAERRTGFFALTATLVMTELNTATMVSFASLGYLFGLRSLLLPCIFLIGLLFYALSVSKKWKTFDGLSTAQYFSERYGSDLGKLVCVLSLLAMAGFSAVYVKSLTVLFSSLFPTLSHWQLSGIMVCFILLIALRGGLISIIFTDTISFILTILFFPLMLWYVSEWEGSAIEVIKIDTKIDYHVLSIRFVLSLIVLTMFTYILAPWYGQKIFSAKSEKIAYNAVLAAALIIFFLYAVVVLCAMHLPKDQVLLANPEQALAYILHHTLPTGLCGLGYSILLAAGATTLTGVWNAMTAMCIADVSKWQHPFRAVIITALIAFVSYLLANLFVDKIFERMILANIPMAALSFSLLAGFYWERASRGGAYVSIATGLTWGIFSYLWWGEAGEYTWYWAMWGIPLTALTGIIGSYCFPRTRCTA